MIPLTELCKTLIAWAYAVSFVEAPKRRMKYLQRKLGRLLDQIDMAKEISGFPAGKIGRIGTPNKAISYLYNQAMQSIRRQLQSRLPTPQNIPISKYANFATLYGSNPCGLHPPAGGSLRGLRSVYADKYANEGSSEEALRLARYCAYSDDAEQLEDAIALLNRYYPLEALVLELYQEHPRTTAL